MKLYGDRTSTCTRKILTVLAEKGAEAEFIKVELAKGEHKQPQHLARQPFGKVPAIDDDGFHLFESRAIIRYLDEKLPGAKLVPAELQTRARMDQWMSVEYCYFAPAAMRIVYQKLLFPARGLPTDNAIVDAARVECAQVFDALEAHLAGGNKHLVGDQFTLADIGYMPYIEYLFAGGEGALVTSRPNVNAWWNRVSSRASWKKAIGKA